MGAERQREYEEDSGLERGACVPGMSVEHQDQEFLILISPPCFLLDSCPSLLLHKTGGGRGSESWVATLFC